MSRWSAFTSSTLSRLLLGYALVAALFAGTWLLSLYGPVSSAAIAQQERNLTAVAQSAALAVSTSDEPADVVVKQLVARTDLRLTMIGGDGAVLAESHLDRRSPENNAELAEVRTALSGDVGVERRVSAAEALEQLYVAVPGSFRGDRVVVRVSQPVAEIERIAARARRGGLLLLGVSLLAAVLVAVRSLQSAAEPLGRLTATAARMADGNLEAPVPLMPSDLAPLGSALSTLRDEVRERIDALDRERRVLRATLDGLADAVFVLEKGIVRLANRSAGHLFAEPAEGWSGIPIDEAGLPAPLLAHVRDRSGRGESSAEELEADPTGRTLRVVVAPLEGTVASGRTVVVVSDVTERAQLDRTRRDFVANASHELKTPVAGIRLLAESAASAAADGDAEQAVAFAGSIGAETERLQRLVGDLLDLSRLETAPRPDSLTDVRQAVGNAVTAHASAASRKGLELVVDVGAVRDEDVFAAADPTDLAIALDNLLDNAIAYTLDGSVCVTVSATDDRVVIAVTDTGPGIPPEHLPRIFERFYRVDRARSRESGGTGLGLALVRHVVERSGGTVSVSAGATSGSTFTLTLPRAR